VNECRKAVSVFEVFDADMQAWSFLHEYVKSGDRKVKRRYGVVQMCKRND
jgi:hypothetical protein